MQNNLITSEDDVRTYVRQASAGRVRWVEPALGSTPGLPDCWVPLRCGRQVHLELKAGNLTKGILRYKVRPEQKREIAKMADDGVPVGLLIGIKGSKLVVFARPRAIFLFGEWSMRSDDLAEDWESWSTDSVGRFWSGVNFIFSDFQKAM
jgi:hypothetical protein